MVLDALKTKFKVTWLPVFPVHPGFTNSLTKWLPEDCLEEMEENADMMAHEDPGLVVSIAGVDDSSSGRSRTLGSHNSSSSSISGNGVGTSGLPPSQTSYSSQDIGVEETQLPGDDFTDNEVEGTDHSTTAKCSFKLASKQN